MRATRFALALSLIALTACGGVEGEKVTQSEYGDAWPLTVSEIYLRCQSPKLINFYADGEIYALNGSARTHAADYGWKDFQTVWRADPQNPDYKILPSPLIERGLKLCKA